MPVKKSASTVVVSDKYNLKPIPLKRQRCDLGPPWGAGGQGHRVGAADHCPLCSAAATPGDAAPPAEKKYKPLNTTPNTTKEIKVKIIPPQRECRRGPSTGGVSLVSAVPGMALSSWGSLVPGPPQLPLCRIT